MFQIFLLAIISIALVAAQTKTQYTVVSGGGCPDEEKAGFGMFVRLQLSLSDQQSKEYMLRDNMMNLQVGGSNVVGALSAEGLLGACKGEKRTIISSNAKGQGYAGETNLMLPWLGSEKEITYQKDATRLLYFEVIVDQIMEEDDYKLFDYIQNDDVGKAIEVLKSESIDIGMQDDFGQTPLIASVGSNLIQITATILNMKPKSMSMAQLVNIAKPSGHTALFYAVQQEDPVVLKVLLKKGADPNLALAPTEKSAGWTAMHFAVFFGKRDYLKLMLQYGGDPYATTKDGLTIVDVCDVAGQLPGFKRKVIQMINERLDELDEEDERREAA
eukprot:CAMPEP_0118664136 /NCGR_PEP_ID=MMETSP0785-20121206/17831_1 /TAXON_ID=91992 /ORGANISM="Bolidomonas pacifica, Strain CCMP 1866" /LENGTH=329 /DNA_ID=CAMNT_0006557981 /DNA_START=131 /DNA_END=1118 /DNA_ORIENTATION=+